MQQFDSSGGFTSGKAFSDVLRILEEERVDLEQQLDKAKQVRNVLTFLKRLNKIKSCNLLRIFTYKGSVSSKNGNH